MTSDSPQTFGSRQTSESRRRFLRAVGATTLIAGSGGLAVVAQEGDDANGDGANDDDDAGDDDAGDDANDDGTDDDLGVETVALDARVDGWRGVVPDPIDGETNPALDVAAGETYRVVWQNDDGEPHNFSVVDQAGGTLPVLRVLDVSSEEAAPVFEASGGTIRTGENLEIVATEDDDDDRMETDDDDRTETDDDDDQDDRGTATDDDRDDDDDDGGTETDDDDDGDDDDDATETGTAGMETGDDVVTDTPADLMAVTETISQDGAIQAVEFEVTEEMAQYQCQVHPGSMVGDLEVSTDDDNDDNDDDGTDDDNDDGGDDDNDDNNDDNDDGGDNNNDGTDDDNDDNNDGTDDDNDG